MRKLLITWQDGKQFPHQHLTVECKNLDELIKQLDFNGISPVQVVNLRPAYFGDKEFPVLHSIGQAQA